MSKIIISKILLQRRLKGALLLIFCYNIRFKYMKFSTTTSSCLKRRKGSNQGNQSFALVLVKT